MDTVPFAFCDAVCSSLEKLPGRIIPGVWGAALKDHLNLGRLIRLGLCLEEGQWLCGISSVFDGEVHWKTDFWGSEAYERGLSFEEVLRIPEKYLRFDSFLLTNSMISQYPDPFPVTEEHLVRIVSFAKKFTRSAKLNLLTYPNDRTTGPVRRLQTRNSFYP
uniref:Uncharacterized protein n=1 Tax=Steinernema glaseri TaxID=37863 RepID=A0A1I7Y3D8_9BILA